MQIGRKAAEESPGRRLGKFIAHTTGGKHVNFVRESQYDIFGALKDSALKPKLVLLDDVQGEASGLNSFSVSPSLARLFRRMESQ